jgi:hypothetical protein
MSCELIFNCDLCGNEDLANTIGGVTAIDSFDEEIDYRYDVIESLDPNASYDYNNDDAYYYICSACYMLDNWQRFLAKENIKDRFKVFKPQAVLGKKRGYNCYVGVNRPSIACCDMRHTTAKAASACGTRKLRELIHIYSN